MGTPKTAAMIPPASRMARVSYSIRRVVAEARKAEAAGKRIHYLNTGDPVAFGFKPPAHMVEAVHKSLRDGENGYGPSSAADGARGGGGRKHVARLARHCRPRRADVGLVRRHRLRADRAGRSRR